MSVLGSKCNKQKIFLNLNKGFYKEISRINHIIMILGGGAVKIIPVTAPSFLSPERKHPPPCHLFLIFVFRATLSDQGTPGRLQGPLGTVGIEPQLIMHEANILPAVLSFSLTSLPSWPLLCIAPASGPSRRYPS